MGNSISPHLENAQKTGVCSLCGNRLSEVPPELFHLGASLRTLDLSNNKIKVLPSAVGGFTSLKNLTLTSNHLGSLPLELSQLKKLEILAVDKNSLKTLPAGLFTNLTHLKTLSLSSNLLTAFPESLGALRHLDAIDLSDNKIRTLPDSVGDLQVVELNMNRNQIASLPDSLASCTRLKVLRIEENCLPLEAVTPQLLKESSISLLAVEGNLFDIKQLRETEGFDQYMARFTATKKKFT
ncbi:leucine-rich repeat-containing protein 57-like [Porites lutea]|uniref:leucine-rich repeat-containing protein 57-like n=1 Tax=Porites lutea TaxID=51062 RepID=UPI003CC6CA81